MMKEQWKDIPSCLGYQVSSLGRVRSLARWVTCKSSKGKIYRRRLEGKLMLHNEQRGYSCIVLRCGGKYRGLKIHRLVWESFRGPIPEGYQIDHIDGKRNNNFISNLEAVTPAENSWRSPSTRITKEIYYEAVALRNQGWSWARIGRHYNVTYQAVQNWFNGKTKLVEMLEHESIH